MPLAAGVASSGKTGALALQSLATGGVLRYVPVAGFSPSVSRGDALVPLINNANFSTNKTLGISIGNFVFSLPLIPAITPADFFARAIGSTAGDTDAANYHTLTMYPDNNGDAPDVFALSKFDTFSGQVAFSANGAAQAVAMTLSGRSIDPYSGSVTALAAPSAGALSTGGVQGFAQTVITGATQVVGVSWQVGTGLVTTAGAVAGTNSNFPYLAKGLLQTGIGGIVTVTQYRNAATVLGLTGANGSLDLAFGATGNGLGMTFELMPLSIARPSTQSVNMMTSTYALVSVDGTTSPIAFRNL